MLCWPGCGRIKVDVGTRVGAQGDAFLELLNPQVPARTSQVFEAEGELDSHLLARKKRVDQATTNAEDRSHDGFCPIHQTMDASLSYFTLYLLLLFLGTREIIKNCQNETLLGKKNSAFPLCTFYGSRFCFICWTQRPTTHPEEKLTDGDVSRRNSRARQNSSSWISNCKSHRIRRSIRHEGVGHS